jgi:hypothetical protein
MLLIIEVWIVSILYSNISNIRNTINNNDRNNMNNTCCYGCNTPIFWNPVKGEYWEVYKNKKHICRYLEKQQIQH